MTPQDNPLRLRLETLEKEHDKLLASIARKRAKVEINAERAERASQEVARLMSGLQERAQITAKNILVLFNSLLGPKSSLSKHKKKTVQSIFDEVRESLLLQELVSSGQSPAGDGEQGFPGDPEDIPWDDAGPSYESVHETAPKPSQKDSASLKALFKRLAVALHPDRSQDEREKAKRTQIMAEVTQAYEQTDLARLLDLEQLWLRQESPNRESDEALLARIERLLATNKELRRQLRALQKEDTRLRRNPAGIVDPTGAVQLVPEVQLVLDDLEVGVAEMEQIERHVQRFVDGEIGFGAFCKGPKVDTSVFLDGRASDLVDDALLNEIAYAFVDEMMTEERTQRRPKHRKTKRKQVKRTKSASSKGQRKARK